jgi:hypothetical protein
VNLQQLHIALKCGGGFVKLVPAADWTTENSWWNFNNQFFDLRVRILKSLEEIFSCKSTRVMCPENQ